MVLSSTLKYEPSQIQNTILFDSVSYIRHLLAVLHETFRAAKTVALKSSPCRAASRRSPRHGSKDSIWCQPVASPAWNRQFIHEVPDNTNCGAYKNTRFSQYCVKNGRHAKLRVCHLLQGTIHQEVVFRFPRSQPSNTIKICHERDCSDPEGLAALTDGLAAQANELAAQNRRAGGPKQTGWRCA